MKMTLRWFGSKYDTVTLKQIRQIPGVTGVISTLYGTTPGEVWKMEDILALKKEIEDAGLELTGIESVNIHDSIKIGTPDREQYIDNYITTLERLGQAGIHMVCYNFMPVFDWTRTELARVRPDGSTVLAYTQEAVDALNPEDMFASISGDANGAILPGWEPERMAHIKELFEMYKDVTDEKLFATIDIEFGGQVIHVQLGTDDFDQLQREGKTYTEQLVVTVDGDSSEPQDADVVVYDNEDGTIDFELKNFILSAGEGFNLYVGTIYVENITTEVGEDGLTHFSYNGDITIQEGDLEGVDMWLGPLLCKDEEGNPVGIPIVLSGKMTDDKLFAILDLEFGGQVIHVQLGTDDFAAFKRGDVNQDNTVDIADAVSVLNAMAGQEVAGDPDVNGDQVVDIADLVTVLNIMAGQ